MSLFGQTNIALGKPVVLNGSFPGPGFTGNGVCTPLPAEPAASLITSATFLPETSCYDLGIYWDNHNPANEIDISFGGTFLINAAAVQADDNDTYQLDYLGTDAAYHPWWTVGTAGSFGLVTRPSGQGSMQSLPAVNATGVRIYAPAGSGDGVYGVGKVQVFSSQVAATPVPPAIWLSFLGLIAIGLFFATRGKLARSV